MCLAGRRRIAVRRAEHLQICYRTRLLKGLLVYGAWLAAGRDVALDELSQSLLLPPDGLVHLK